MVGATGIAGSTLVDQLLEQGWAVLGLARRSGPDREGLRWVTADLTCADDLARVLADERVTHAYFTAWLRQDTEQQNIDVNAGTVRNLLAALQPSPLVHVALMTGLKHYLGPFEAYGQGTMPDTPFREEEPRLDVANFYYAQEDELFAAAPAQGFHWSVHRSHTVIGHAVGNARNMGLTLAVQAAICRHRGPDRPRSR